MKIRCLLYAPLLLMLALPLGAQASAAGTQTVKPSAVYRAPTSDTFAAVSEGEGFTCVLRNGGAKAGMPFCWGSNPLGQIAAPNVKLTQLATGFNYACGLKTNKTLTCWGAAPAAKKLPGGAVKQIGAGGNFLCIILANETIACRGDNELGETEPPSGKFTQISSNGTYSCALHPSGVPACWGGDYDQKTSQSFVSLATSGGEPPCGIIKGGAIRCFGQGASSFHHPAGSFKKIFGGESQYCAIPTGGGPLNCFGSTVLPPPSDSFTTASLGIGTGCGLTQQHSLVCWGDDSFGQALLPTSPFTEVSSGNVYACGLHADGSPMCWEEQQIGYPPPTVASGSYTQISSGVDFGCGIRPDKSVTCWGANGSGQATPPSGTFTDVSAGDALACGVRTDGTVTCWGDPAHGDLKAPSGNFKTVSASLDFACATGGSSRSKCWGDDTFGQLDPISATPPHFSQISAGYGFTCGLRPSPGSWVDCFGEDAYIVLKATDVSAGNGLACAITAKTGEPTCWGDRSGYDHSNPPAVKMSMVSVGGILDPFVCGLQSGGVRCWGQLPLWIPHYS